jgi:hypothetical protein
MDISLNGKCHLIIGNYFLMLREMINLTKITDDSTFMVFTISFLPNTGNRYFMASCDSNINIYDFENATLIQSFPDIFSYYCDCSKFIKCLDFEQPPEWSMVDAENPMFSYLITRGVESLDDDTKTLSLIF